MSLSQIKKNKKHFTEMNKTFFKKKILVPEFHCSNVMNGPTHTWSFLRSLEVHMGNWKIENGIESRLTLRNLKGQEYV